MTKPPSNSKQPTPHERSLMKGAMTNRMILDNAQAITAYARRKGWISERAEAFTGDTEQQTKQASAN